ncbi:imidazoleglycerol-phosphate dehydratase (IGPD) [Neisseria gonorrhoeae]|uniref:Imidazoleglycerol-phosphate dehydratase (IGPD) n=1 Tax=Neisseria gonorrhoeae TaxID=485 RepID=A0A378VUE2_NEIGO|nr:imidazoleglycerol-phosphate dehydratase (IGPD) [Neisseria gonorrhoeae]
MTKTQLHLNNFLTLAQEAGSLPKLAKLCGYRTPVALYKLKQRLEKQAEDPDARGIRPSLMAKLEKHTGKPKGWLDRKHRERTVPKPPQKAPELPKPELPKPHLLPAAAALPSTAIPAKPKSPSPSTSTAAAKAGWIPAFPSSNT